MKVKDGFILRVVAGQFVVVPVGTRTVDFNGMITLNSSGKFLFELLKKDVSKQELIAALQDRYEIDDETATKDVGEFVSILSKHQLLD